MCGSSSVSGNQVAARHRETCGKTLTIDLKAPGRQLQHHRADLAMERMMPLRHRGTAEAVQRCVCKLIPRYDCHRGIEVWFC